MFPLRLLNIIKEELTLVCLCPPAAYIRFHIISPVIQQSAKKWVQAQMWPFEKSVCFLPAVLINISLSPAIPLSPVSHSFNFIPFFIATIFPFTFPLTSRPSLLLISSFTLLSSFLSLLLIFVALPFLSTLPVTFTASIIIIIIIIPLSSHHPSLPVFNLLFLLFQCRPVRPVGQHPRP